MHPRQSCPTLRSDQSVSRVSLPSENFKVRVTMPTFKCDVCDKRLCNVANLRRHLLTVHVKDKRFECATCGAKFALKWNLKRHLLERHAAVKPLFKCSSCPCTFKRKESLAIHVARDHSRRHTERGPARRTPAGWRCTECGAFFRTQDELMAHLWTHLREDRPQNQASVSKQQSPPCSTQEDRVCRALRGAGWALTEQQDGEEIWTVATKAIVPPPPTADRKKLILKHFLRDVATSCPGAELQEDMPGMNFELMMELNGVISRQP